MLTDTEAAAEMNRDPTGVLARLRAARLRTGRPPPSFDHLRDPNLLRRLSDPRRPIPKDFDYDALDPNGHWVLNRTARFVGCPTPLSTIGNAPLKKP